MQEEVKLLHFKQAVGRVIQKIRKSKTGLSINKFALEYDFDKGNLSKIERGQYNIYLYTAWKIIEALDIDFSEFAKMLKEELGDDFTFIDE